MSRYRRSLASGGTFFFTVNLADCESRMRVTEIDRLRNAFWVAQAGHAFRSLAYYVLRITYCVMPDHLHDVWQLPESDADFGLRWRVIKRLFQAD